MTRRCTSVADGTRCEGAGGFTLVELLVAIVIAAVLMAAVYQVMVSNQRVSSVQREQVRSQQTVRAGLTVLAQELREVSAAGGDLLVIEPTRVGFRAFRGYGIVCDVGSISSRSVTVAPLGRDFQSEDGLYVFADGNSGIEADDQWLLTAVSSAQADHTCGSGDSELAAQLIALGGLSDAQFAAIQGGAAVRAWEAVEYGLQEFEDGWYLVRDLEGETARLVGPLAGGDGLELEYLAVDGSSASDPGDVARVRITLRTDPPARDEWGHTVGDTLTTAVYLRN